MAKISNPVKMGASRMGNKLLPGCDADTLKFHGQIPEAILDWIRFRLKTHDI
jgi:hypothetical protein